MSETTELKPCQAGCMSYDGGEKRHHKDCVYYPESFTKMYDALREDNARLEQELEVYKTSENAEISILEEKNARLREALEKREKERFSDDLEYQIDISEKAALKGGTE